MELTDVTTAPVTPAHGRGGEIDLHKAGCRDLGNRGRYPKGPDATYPVGTTGEAIVRDWFDNGILEEAVADKLYQCGGERSVVEREVLDNYTYEFDVKPCAAKLFTQET